MKENSPLNALDKLIETMATLRSTDGCQWDREQSPQSLKPYILEEAYELLEAIDHDNPAEICDELGDLLLQVVFLAQIFTENEDFTLKDVAETINSKLIRRHPHIFAKSSHAGHQKRWDQIKLKERSDRGQSNLLIDRIPKTLPALKLAAKTIKKLEIKASYTDTYQALNKLEPRNVSQMRSDVSVNNASIAIGEILFSVTALANSIGVDAEDCLRQKTNKMIAQFDNSKELL